ncbi:MAG: PHP-associated domain-containing protein [Nanoarchaeota archaeon]|nr:PHP-associated domain-containing protein [Nanoarchaeota archaeon]
MKLDLHVHSKYSVDSFTRLKSLKEKENRTGIIPIITDHNEIIGNKKYKCPILASEITSKEGDVIGYFITERIKPKMSAIETIEEIHSQGGLASIPHPFDRFRNSALRIPKLIRKADIIEGFNARVQKQKDNKKAFEFAKKNEMPAIATSDSHIIWEFGKSYIDIEPFASPKEFLKNLKKAKLFGKTSSIIYPIGTILYYKILGNYK